MQAFASGLLLSTVKYLHRAMAVALCLCFGLLFSRKDVFQRLSLNLADITLNRALWSEGIDATRSPKVLRIVGYLYSMGATETSLEQAPRDCDYLPHLLYADYLRRQGYYHGASVALRNASACATPDSSNPGPMQVPADARVAPSGSLEFGPSILPRWGLRHDSDPSTILIKDNTLHLHPDSTLTEDKRIVYVFSSNLALPYWPILRVHIKIREYCTLTLAEHSDGEIVRHITRHLGTDQWDRFDITLNSDYLRSLHLTFQCDSTALSQSEAFAEVGPLVFVFASGQETE